MKRLFLTAGLSLLGVLSKAQQNYDASLIPKELLSYANTVIRNSEENVDIKATDNQVYHIKRAITVLNKNGDDNAHIVVWYDHDQTIKYIKGTVYNAFGKPVSKFSERDFQDVYAGGEESLFEDLRVKHYQPAVMEYPYTVEYEYETREKQTLSLPDWDPNPEEGISIQKSSFVVTCVPGTGIRYKEINVPKKVELSTGAAGQKVYFWEVNNLKAVRDEPFSPIAEKHLTMVKLAPEKFTYGKIAGSYTNWNDLGKWMYDKLLQGRDDIPSETASYIKQITAGITDPKQKAKKIYEYMQQKTRYISVQVGIGGLQPFLASDVDKNSYGDCKALVNYTHSLLKIAGIDSWYCVVKSGSRKKSLMPDFASVNQADHVILCLPFKNDTTWLECTSQKIPFGYLGDFTDDRWVLACTPEGGKLLHTPRYEKSTLTKRKAELVIDAKGDLAGTMTTTFTGTDFEDRDEVIDEPYTDQLKEIARIYPITNFGVEKLEYVKSKSTDPVVTENIKLNSREFAALNAGKYYFKINLANRAARVPNEVRNRTSEVYINRGFTEDDEITYTLPAGYKPEKQLVHKTIEKPYGKYMVNMELHGQQLVYKRMFQLNDGSYSKDSYQDLVDMFQTMSEVDNYNMVLIKSN